MSARPGAHFMIECLWQMALCSVFVIAQTVVNSRKTFCCFQHIHLKVTTLVGGSRVCRANDFLLLAATGISAWVTAASNAERGRGLRSVDAKLLFPLTFFCARSVLFVIKTFDYWTELILQSMTCQCCTHWFSILLKYVHVLKLHCISYIPYGWHIT